MTASDWAARVAAVPLVLDTLCVDAKMLAAIRDRDARIGRKFAAALKERVRHSCGSNVEDSGLVCRCGEWSSPVSGAWEASYLAHAAAAATRAFQAAT